MNIRTPFSFSRYQIPGWLIIPLLFYGDSFIYALYAKPVVSLLLCYYIRTILSKTSIFLLSFLMIGLLLESFLYCGIFGAPLFYLIPITLLGNRIRHLFYDAAINRYLLLSACLLLQALCEPQPLFLSALLMPYTYLKIGVNIIVMILFF